MNKTQLFYKALTTVAISSIIVSCAQNDSRYIPIDNSYMQSQSKNTEINYVPNIQIISKDDKLVQQIKQTEDKRFNITEPNFAVLKLFIETSLIPDQLEKPEIKLVGILKKDKRSYNYKVSYKLVDGINNTITQGEVIGINDNTSKDAGFSNNSAINDAAKQIVEKINAETSDILIDFKIVSVSPQSVYIAINPDIKLLNNEIFLVNELPRTALNFSQVITNGKESLAELKVITGDFPKVGMTVNLQK